MPEPLTVKQLMWLCAKYERECLSGLEHDYGSCAAGCRDGYVPLLKGVREECLVRESYWVEKPTMPFLPISGVKTERHPLSDCYSCHDLGWTPTEDVWKWFQAVHEGVFYLGVPFRLGFYSTPAAFFLDLEVSLRPLAVNAAEAEEWVRENVACMRLQ